MLGPGHAAGPDGGEARGGGGGRAAGARGGGSRGRGGGPGLGDGLHGLAEDGVGLLLLPPPRAVSQQPQEPHHVHLAPARVIRGLHRSDHHRAQHAGGDRLKVKNLISYVHKYFFIYLQIFTDHGVERLEDGEDLLDLLLDDCEPGALLPDVLQVEAAAGAGRRQPRDLSLEAAPLLGPAPLPGAEPSAEAVNLPSQPSYQRLLVVKNIFYKQKYFSTNVFPPASQVTWTRRTPR